MYISSYILSNDMKTRQPHKLQESNSQPWQMDDAIDGIPLKGCEPQGEWDQGAYVDGLHKECQGRPQAWIDQCPKGSREDEMHHK